MTEISLFARFWANGEGRKESLNLKKRKPCTSSLKIKLHAGLKCAILEIFQGQVTITFL